MLKKFIFFLLSLAFLSTLVLIFVPKTSNYLLSDKKSVEEFNCKRININPRNDLVIINETTHGSESVREINTCIVKYLSTRYGFNTLFLEWDYSEIDILNAYINGNPNVTKQRIFDIFKNSFYDSIAFFDLIEWAKLENRSARKISFFGIDNFNSSQLVYRSIIGKNPRTSKIRKCIEINMESIEKITTNCQSLMKMYLETESVDSLSDEYFIWLLNQNLTLLASGSSDSESYNLFRDLSMYKIFEEIYRKQKLNSKKEKAIMIVHAGHGLNFKGRFGSYLYKSNFNFSEYIISVCSGKISSYSSIEKLMIDLTISELDKNLIENSICKRDAIDYSKNTRFLYYPIEFTLNYSKEIPNFDFEGFFVALISKPLTPYSK